MSLRAFDVSHWGFFRFHGPDVKKFLQGLVTADLNRLVPGTCLPACVLTPKGQLVADCELYEEAPDTVLAVTRPAAAAGFRAAFEKKIMLSESTFEAFHWGRAWLIIGEGVDRGLPWTRLGEPARLVPGADPPADALLLGPAEFEALRVSAGFPWFGADMDSESLPLEARQEAAISMDKGCYMGQETVARIVFRGHVNKVLMGLRCKGQAPAPGDLVLREGREIGRITSAAGDTALGMIRHDDAVSGAPVTVAGATAELFIFSAWPKPLSKS